MVQSELIIELIGQNPSGFWLNVTQNDMPVETSLKDGCFSRKWEKKHFIAENIYRGLFKPWSCVTYLAPTLLHLPRSCTILLQIHFDSSILSTFSKPTDIYPFLVSLKLCYCVEIPDPGAYKESSCFDFEKNRAIMPKTNYYSFGLSASRDAYNKVFTPGDHNSPRGKDMKD